MRRPLFLYLFIALSITLSFLFCSRETVFATSGAYIDTKHGGGTVDGIKFDGVNRAINPDYSLYYNDSAEGGQYAASECAHCHEPHASFGGAEPAPVTGSPSPYLLMKYGNAPETNYSSLCWYCHENIFGGAGPGTGYWGFYKGTGIYQASSHYLNLDGGSAMAWPGGTGGASGVGNATDATAIWARRGRSTLPAGNNGSCLNCHTPHGIKGTYDATGAAPATTNYLTGGTAAATDIPRRQLIAREEALCLNCHDTDGPASTNIKGEVDSWGYVAPTQWNATQGSGHPVRQVTYFNRHNLSGLDGLASTTNDNEPPAFAAAGGWFSAASKHAECVDCHNPHAVQGIGSNAGGFWAAPWGGGVYQWSIGPTYNAAGAWNTNRNVSSTDNSAIRLAAQNKGTWGVTVSTATGDITGIISSLQSWNDATPNYVYNLCLKCHSYWAWGATNAGPPTGNAPWNSPSTTRSFTGGAFPATNRGSLPMTNQSWELATNRVAYHPVFGQGKNQPDQAGVKNPCWCSGYTCPPAGTGQTGYPDASCTARNGTRTDLTGNDIPTLSQNFVPPWRHTSRVTCTDCHENNSEAAPRGPHGSSRPFVLRALDTTISYARTNLANCTYSTANSCGSGTVSTADPNNMCLNCHRPDVYGWANQTSSVAPLEDFPRQPHSTFNGGDAFSGNQPDSAPNGIVCMLCHGGARNVVGTIHGSDYTACQGGCPNDGSPCIPPTCSTSGRLIVTTGADLGSSEWIRWTKSSIGNAGSCEKGSTSPYCNGNTNDGGFDRGANYNY